MSAQAAAVSPSDPAASRGNVFGFAAMVVGMFMAILDIQIVASSLSEIQAGVSASRDEISWVQTSYLIAEVMIIPLSGWLARVFSTHVLFSVSAAGFTLASLACALSWNLDSLIVFRALQGLLGGAMIPSVFSTSFLLFPGSKRASATVLIGLVATMAPTLGPTLGGWITDALSWHWLFLLNLAPGLFVSWAVFSNLRIDVPHFDLLKKIDFPGIVLLCLSLGSLQYVLEEGSRNDWFQSATILFLTVLSATSALLLLWRELSIDSPVVELRVFADRNFFFGCMFSFIIGVGLYGFVYLLPVFLGAVRGYTATNIGLIVMVAGAFQFVSSPVIGRLSTRIPPRLMLACGISLFALSSYLCHFITAEWSYWELFLPQALRGVSMLMLFMPINTLALGTLPASMLPNASGLYNLMRNLGGAIGLAILNTLLNNQDKIHYQSIAASVNSARSAATEALDGLQAYLALSLGDAAELGALQIVANLAEREALVTAFADMFRLLCLGFVLALFLVPFLKNPAPGAKPAEAH